MSHAPDIGYGPTTNDTEAHEFADIAAQSLAASPPIEPDFLNGFRERWRGGAEFRVIRRGGSVAGGLAFLPMAQWFGGAAVPSGAVSAVAIAPEHRRRGMASAMMRELIRELRERGMPLSVLYPASLPLYRSAGYELAGAHITYKVRTSAMATKSGEMEVRPLREADHPRLKELHDERARETTGCFLRNEWMWNRILRTPKVKTLGYVVEHGGVVEGYVVFTHQPEPTVRYDIVVKDLVGSTGRARRALMALLASHASMAPHVFFLGAPADPWLAMIHDVDAYEIHKRIDWMLRVVDVKAALEARGYPDGLRGEFHLSVADEFIAENRGRWVLDVAEGRGQVRAGGSGAIDLDVKALASLYSGYLSGMELLRTGRLAGPHPEVRALGAAFAGPAPWMPDMF